MDQPQPFWSWCPQPGAGRASTLMVDVAPYGDGYIHRATRGLNPVRPTWTLNFPFEGLATLDEMDTFLRSNAASGFYFQPPDDDAPLFVTADAWQATIADKNLDRGVVGLLSVTFAECFNPQPHAPTPDASVPQSVSKSLAYLKAQAEGRTPYVSTTLVPDDLGIDRHSTGPWTGLYTLPVDPNPGVPYSPVLIEGPLWFPVTAGARVDFSGRVDVPFYTMDGYAGHRQMVNPAPPPPYIDDPNSIYADGGTNWGRYYVLGTVNGVKQFLAPIAANATWADSVNPVPAGAWSFQIVTYASKADADADANRIMVGHAWLQTERPGDVRDFYSTAYLGGSPQFVGVTLSGAGPYVIQGSLQGFTEQAGFTYQILVTNETDVEYCWALQPVVGPGAFTISRPQPFGGKIKLRLMEQQNGCSVRQVGVAWAEENAVDAGAYPDLRIEYRAITDLVPPFPTSIQPAQKDRTWRIAALAAGGAVGRVSLVNVNTRRILGQYTMPSGLMRSFIVPASDAGQDTTSVYYDGFQDTCFLYDQSVALVAFLTLGETTAAQKLVDALLTVQASDGSFPFSSGQATLYDRSSGGFSRIGAVAWVCYALLLCDQPPFKSWFFETPTTDAAKRCLDYIRGFTNSIGTINGGKGRYVDGVLDPSYVVPWWSVEHNIDCWWCFDLADQLYGSGVVNYRQAADLIKAAMLTTGYGWDGIDGIFWQGGVATAGANVPDGMHALDTHSWGATLLEKWNRQSDAVHSLARADQYYYVTDPASGLSGYTTFVPVDGYPANTVTTPWYEGSFGVVCAYRGTDVNYAGVLMQRLVRGQRSDGSYLYALQNDPVNDIHAWPAIIGSAWNILAMSGPGTSRERVLWPVP
jgi:phage-related protein